MILSIKFKIPRNSTEIDVVAYFSALDDEGIVKHGKLIWQNGVLGSRKIAVVPPVVKRIDGKTYNPWYAKDKASQEQLESKVIQEFENQFGPIVTVNH